jgi:hypothetical protein
MTVSVVLRKSPDDEQANDDQHHHTPLRDFTTVPLKSAPFYYLYHVINVLRGRQEDATLKV